MAREGGREKRHARTRQAILDAAQQIITESGVEGLSMRELATRIDYSPAGLYEYFRSKDEIIQELCTEGFTQLTERISYRATGETPLHRLVQCGMAYLEFALQHREQYLLMFSIIPPHRLSLEDVKQDSAYSKLRQLVQQCIDAHELPIREGYGMEEISYQLWAFLHGVVMLRLTLFSKEGADFDAFNRQAIENAVASLRTT